MKTIEIKSIKGDLLFSHTKENATIKDAVEQALKECVSLRSANLRSANLISADLSLANLRSANLPIYCKWMVSIKDDKIVIGCKSKTIEDWDVFFASDEVYNTNRDTNDFKQIEAAYQAHKAYLNFLNKK